MRIKVAELLKKAVGALRGKASVLRARLLFLASLRRRTAVVGAISHHLRTLMPPANNNNNANAPPAPPLPAAAEEDNDGHLVGLSELASLFQEVVDDDGERYPDWTHSLFEEDGEEEASVMEVIRRRREGEGEEEIDHAADMFIRPVRHRMAASRRSF